MGVTNDDQGSVGPTLFLESTPLDADEAFCTDVFDDASGEYRVVQFTAAQSFESLREALDVQLERIRDPSEAAVIITTPQADEEATTSEVGEGTPLYGFQVDPHDLTGISVAFSRLIEKWDETEGTVRICLRDIESLLPYHDDDLVYRFLNTVLATLQGAGADVHAHLHPTATDEQTLHMLKSLFTQVVEPGESDATVATATTEPKREDTADPSEATTATTAAMTDAEIDAFLDSTGYGVLAFGGDGPYAVPMSYGYDAARRELYLHMSSFEGSEKQTRLEESTAVSLVVTRYERPDRWRSVVVDGQLERLSSEEVRDRNVHAVFADSKLASVDVFSPDPSEISFEWYALTPTDMTGRQGAGSL
jgi:nitroimidazol reductase NimA-like FMN-containing flavoprotein (pyridoxamine 5'-phosphate oxidase superfamily)